MSTAFYVAAVVAVLATIRAITHVNAVRALLYLIVSFFGVAVMFYLLGAPFAAALEVITYAGAIMVLFVFVMMMLNLGPTALRQERGWLAPSMWVGPGILCGVLLGELIYAARGAQTVPFTTIEPAEVAMALFGPYVLGVELASVLLLAGLVGAYHLGYRKRVAEVREKSGAIQEVA